MNYTNQTLQPTNRLLSLSLSPVCVANNKLIEAKY